MLPPHPTLYLGKAGNRTQRLTNSPTSPRQGIHSALQLCPWQLRRHAHSRGRMHNKVQTHQHLKSPGQMHSSPPTSMRGHAADECGRGMPFQLWAAHAHKFTPVTPSAAWACRLTPTSLPPPGKACTRPQAQQKPQSHYKCRPTSPFSSFVTEIFSMSPSTLTCRAQRSSQRVK